MRPIESVLVAALIIFGSAPVVRIKLNETKCKEEMEQFFFLFSFFIKRFVIYVEELISYKLE